MCEADVQDCFTPAGFVTSLGSDPVTIEFPNSPGSGTFKYGKALKERFPVLPSDPYECVRLIHDMTLRGFINVTVAGNYDTDRDYCPCILYATISAKPNPVNAPAA